MSEEMEKREAWKCLQGNRKLYDFFMWDLKNDQMGLLKLKNMIIKLKNSMDILTNYT